jgi:hypothetical protein
MFFFMWTCGDDVRTRVEPFEPELLDLLPTLKILRAMVEGEVVGGSSQPGTEVPEEDEEVCSLA